MGPWLEFKDVALRFSPAIDDPLVDPFIAVEGYICSLFRFSRPFLSLFLFLFWSTLGDRIAADYPLHLAGVCYATPGLDERVQ